MTCAVAPSNPWIEEPSDYAVLTAEPLTTRIVLIPIPADRDAKREGGCGTRFCDRF